MTKQQLLDNLATLPKQTLERLWAYSDMLLIPESDLLINTTMKDTFDKAMSLADTHYPAWTDRSHSDFGRFLVELICLFDEKNFWYINAWYNEVFLQNTRSYGIAYYTSLRLGYTPTLYRAAGGNVQLTFSAGPSITIKPGDITVKIQGRTFSNTETFTLTSTLEETRTVAVAEGKYSTKIVEFKGRGITLPDSSIDAQSIHVSINGVTWNQVLSFSEAGGTDKVFFSLPEENAGSTLFFGDGVLGARPTIGDSVTVLYKIGGGAAPAITAGTVTVESQPTGRSVTTATLGTTITGGKDQESLASVKSNAPAYMRTSGRITNTSDAIKILLMQPEVSKAQAILFADLYTFYVIPTSGTPADGLLMQDLTDRLKDVVVEGYQWAGVVTNYINLAPLVITAYVQPGYGLEDVCSQIASLTGSYTNPLEEAQYGQSFQFSSYTGHLVSNIQGLKNAAVTDVAGSPATGAEIAVNAVSIMERLDVSGTFTTSIIPNGISYVVGDLTINAVYTV